jgi:predicted transcriptional regulator
MVSRMNNKRAKDVMVPIWKYPHVHDRDTLRQAIAAFGNCQIEIEGRTSLPRVLLVFDDDERLVGLLRRRDILRGLEPRFLVNAPLEYRRKLFDVGLDPNLSNVPFEQVWKEIQAQSERQVREVMQPVVATVRHDDALIKVIYELVARNVSLLPVLEGEQVVGVVRTADVFCELAQSLK